MTVCACVILKRAGARKSKTKRAKANYFTYVLQRIIVLAIISSVLISRWFEEGETSDGSPQEERCS